MSSEPVTFVDEERIRERVDAVWNDLRAELERLLPAAEIEHIGSTAIPGTVTKGDLDVCVLVAPGEFAAAEHALAERFARNVGSHHSASLASFVDDARAVPVGVQLVARGGREDFFVRWRDLLRSRPDLIAGYNALKRRWHGRAHDEYRAAKSAFIEENLGLGPPEASPWHQIPAEDYEGHMRDVGQSDALRALFRDVYSSRRPRRLAVLGCTTGSDLALVDSATTELAVGVDINDEYLAIAAERLAPLGVTARLVHGDVLDVNLPGAPFDLVHAALLLEYVEPRRCFERVRGWLAPGGVCCVISQEPAPDLPAVSATPYQSLRVLAAHLVLREADDLSATATAAGLHLVDRRLTRLSSGKVLATSLFALRQSE